MNRPFGAIALAALASLAIIPAAAAQRDGAIIQNSGSTNFSGYTIKVWSDGSTSAVRSRRGGMPLGDATSGQIPLSVAEKLFQDLRSAKHGAQIARRSCVKSVSFGTSTVVFYHGWTSPDLTCPSDGLAGALAADTGSVTAALHMQGQPSHMIPMLPNERRRPEGASASPEPKPSAS